jgi:hypothetical protein
MAYDPTTSVTDDVNDNLASYHNELKTAIDHLMSASSYASYVRTQSMTANVTLTDADLPIQSFSPTAARDLTLPAVASTNHPFYVWNRSGAYAITVKNASAVVIAVLQPYSHVTLQTDGANGWYVIGTSERETAYKIGVSVAADDLILSLTHIDGTTPSTSRPLWFLINGTWRAVSAATSCTLADGTNWMNLGATETATIEQDLFAYVIWDSNSSVVAIAPSRIPYGKLVSDFNATTTNERHIGNYANYSSTDDVAVIGRFAATLSAGAGYTWTVPTFTGANLIQRPIYETRWLTYTPTIAGYSSNPTSAVYMYQIEGGLMRVALREVGDGTSNNTVHTYSAPFSAATRTNMSWYASLPIVMNNGAMEAAGSVSLASASASMAVTRSALGAWTASGACRIPSAVLMCEV